MRIAEVGHVEQFGGEGPDVGFGDPGGPEIGVDVAGEHVLGLHLAESLGVAGIVRPGRFGGGELGPDVAGEVVVGGLPGLRLGVVVDQVAQLGDDPVFRLAVERGDVGQVDGPAMIERDEQPLLGVLDRGDGRWPADDVVVHDGGLGRRAGDLVVFLQCHDEHGVRVLAELDQVGHAADRVAVAGLAEGGLVDGPVGGGEAVVGPVQVAAGPVPVLLGPVLVLGLEDAAGEVA